MAITATAIGSAYASLMAGIVSPRIKQEDLQMTKPNRETREMTFEELEQVSGGDLLNKMIDQAMAALGARLLAAVHTPIVPPINLHMR